MGVASRTPFESPGYRLKLDLLLVVYLECERSERDTIRSK